MSEKLLLGTYTRGSSKGIYSIELNTEEKKLQNLQLKAEVGSPTYLDTSFNGELIYSVVTDGDKGGIGSFKYDGNTFKSLDKAVEEGASPCYVAFDEKRNFVYTANYHDGDISVYETTGEGILTFKDRVKHKGNSVHKNQDAPHAHFFNLTPDEKYVVACDLGTDQVITYEVKEDGSIVKVSELAVDAGTGPRHLAFHPNAKTAYLFGELSGEVLVLDYNLQDGSFEVVQTISTLPEDFSGEHSGAAIRVTKDGRHLYASNRGHNTIVAFNIQADDKLSVIDWYPTEGDGPRDFNLDPSEQFLVVGHQYTDNLTLYERNEADGTLRLSEKDVHAPEVVCVKFV